ncbi:MAG: YfcE family phosphodiesterase [bacterium]|nr:YfcE family phosphodiesterase [bacterium]
MKIAIISDSHDNVVNLEKLINWLNENKISVLIHAGDLCAPAILSKVLATKFTGQIHLILGNVGDHKTLEKIAGQFKNVIYYGTRGEIELDGRKIIFVHFPEEAENLTLTDKPSLVVFGHTHFSEIKTINEIKVVNPGTIGGLFNRATFAIYDTKNEEVELKELEDL